ncbi:MAG: hypothetical protein IPP59_16540 [Betaproteobacteria bacterium]|nr:hypothetical protein [Candidatus Dechloromonas phosphorivorans]
MTNRRLLYLNTHRLSAYAWRQGKLLPEGIFENDEAGFNSFADYLRNTPKSHYSLLANVAEEGHVLETIPFLQGRDRQALITRKIGQHFLGTPFSTAVSLGYEKAKRKNENLLISALTNPAHFEPWLHCINSAAAPLDGIYTVAQLGGQLLKKLGVSKGRCLLLTLQDHSIRESFLVDGQTLFSRMAPLTDSSIAGIASSFAAEASKLHQYLVGQRQVGRDETLPVFIAAHPLALPSVEDACPDRGPLTFAFIDSHIAATKLGLYTPPEDSRSEALFLHLLATSPPRQQFAGEAPRHDYRLSQIRQGLIAIGIIALLGSVLFASKETYQAETFREETLTLAASEADLNRRYQEVSATFPQLGIDNETLRRLTTRYADLTRQQRQPDQAFRSLSRALDEMPNVALDSIEWKIGRISASTAASITGEEEITVIRGTIRPGKNASTRQILASFEAFAERLRSDPSISLSVLQQPFDLESGRSLRGGDGADEISQPRQFALEISRKIAP